MWKKGIFHFLVFCFLAVSLYAEKSFVIVIPSYNNENYVEENLRSVFEQKYSNFKVVYINDASSDGTLKEVIRVVDKYEFHDKIKIVDNEVRRGSLGNIYYSILKYSDQQDIIILLDGDDCLIGKNVLGQLNKVYTNEDVWFTFGQFIHSSNNNIGFCKAYDREVIEENGFRKCQNMPSHLKTFYSWLFRKIEVKDLSYKGKFFPMTGDLAIVLPMIEMAANNHKYINKPLYLYNDENPLNDHRVSSLLQTEISTYIRSLDKYEPLSEDSM